MLTASAMLAAFARRELSPVEVLPAGDDPHGAWAARCPERALAQARAAEAAWRRGAPDGPLCGVPLGVKDLLDTEGTETACGSSLLAGRVPGRDAAAVARARAAGAVVAGKTATVEFAWGLMMTTVRNPLDPARTPGGSSGGSAAALAAGDVPLALGTDTGGSIRLPAGFCGVVGFKPTSGAVPVAGCWPLAPSFDCVGPMARTVADVRRLFAVLCGRAVRPAPSDLRGLRVGVADGAPRGAILAAAGERLRGAGASVVQVVLPSQTDLMATYAPRLLAEALTVHREAGLWPGRRDGYTAPVARRLELAEAQDAGVLAEAERATGRVRAAWAQLWQRVDVVLSPVAASAPPRLDDAEADLRRTASPWLCAQNLLGLPACSVPAGRDDRGLPVGVQVTGPGGADGRVLDAAEAAQAPTVPAR